MVPGDPLTPGWASVPGAKRIPREEAVSLPKIISSPLSCTRRAHDSRDDGGAGGAERSGRAACRSRIASGPGAQVRMKIVLDDKVRPIQTVIGRIRGRRTPTTK